MSMAKIEPESTTHHLTSPAWWEGRLWFRWVMANAAGEFVGLGLAALAGVALSLAVQSIVGSLGPALFFLGMVFLGTFEGAVVGVAQSFVLRDCLPRVRRRTWVFATAVGAFIAWALGMIPSTLMAFNETDTGSTEPTISPFVFYGLAAAMGAILGVIFAVPQWRVLKRVVSRSGIWVPANAAAWALAMPVIFLAASSSPDEDFGVITVILIASSVTAAGAIVGAVHGLALNWIVHRGS
jgi:hypothetical protein